ncbi:MAG: TetR/AcrR family transcriptional regulator [Saprospiraceae bacterium]|nr:TetR/AcrR family transcriptional regulator [Saprospiraceae bacterium]
MSDKKEKEVDPSTEEKIKNAARALFHQKGYSGTRTRDIAEAAGINLALLNYYFRSKQKLFELVMIEGLLEFVGSITKVFDDSTTTLEEKIRLLASNYIDMLSEQPDMPLFVLSELRSHPDTFLSKMNPQEFLMNSSFIKQYQQSVMEGKIAAIHPLQFIMNLIGMIVFPFIVSPMIKAIGNLDTADYKVLMQQRKTLIPIWIEEMMQVK